jgi:hypothetical protein
MNKSLKLIKEFPDAISDSEYWSQLPKPYRWRKIECGGHRDYYGEFECHHYYSDTIESYGVISCDDCICAFSSCGGTLNPKFTYKGNEKNRRKIRMFIKRNRVGRHKLRY